MRNLDNLFHMLDLWHVNFPDLLLKNDLGHVSYNLPHLNLPRYVDMPMNDLDLWHLDDSLNMLDLWNMNLMHLFLSDHYGDMPHLFDDLDWSWHVHMPLDNLNLRHFDDSFYVLNLRHMDLHNLLLCDWHVNMPNRFPHLHWSRNVHMLLDDVNLRHLDMLVLVIDGWSDGCRCDCWQYLRLGCHGWRTIGHGGWCAVRHGLGHVHGSVELLTSNNTVVVHVHLVEGGG